MKAFEEARGELSCDWVRNGDLDLASLRDDPRSRLVLRRYCSGEARPEREDDELWRATHERYRRRKEERRLRVSGSAMG